MGFLGNIFGGGARNIRVQEMISNNAMIIDVRTPAEFQGGNVVGSRNYPLQSIGSKVNEIKKLNRPIVLCCASGMRSGQAANMLKARGIDCENGGGWTNVNSLVNK